MKNAPVLLFFKSHIDTYTRTDGTVVQADPAATSAAAHEFRQWAKNAD